MNTLKNVFKKYKHGLIPLLYFPFYMTAFGYLESKVTDNYHVIHMKIDDHIPFLEIFIIPYLLWFLYIASVVVLFVFLDKKDFYKLCITLGVGMTLFLIISYLIPNGHLLRPTTYPRDNILVDMVKALHRNDTPTNIFPSIHCYNSIMVHIAIMKCEKLKKFKKTRIASFILCTSIILSTVFLKQHSVFDVITAFILAVILYLCVYRPDAIRLQKTTADYDRTSESGSFI